MPLAGSIFRQRDGLSPSELRQRRRMRLAVTEISALAESAIATPSQALANATREVVGVCETVEIMLKRICELYEKADPDKIKALAALDDRVDKKHAAIKLYLAKVSGQQLSEAEALRYQELIGACVKLEQVGDIIVRNMLAHVQKKFDRGLEFTDQGWRELATFHASVLTNARLAFNVLVSRDPKTALHAGARKGSAARRGEADKPEPFHEAPRRRGRSVETSSIHLDTIRDLKQINSLLASIAYPVLEEHGLLRGSRLKTG